MATAKPDMSIIWASAGSSVKPSDAKIQEGWTAEKPPFQSENWVQERQDQFLKHLDEHGVPEWGNGSEYLINSIVWYQDKIWESLQNPNVGNVPTDGLGFWKSQSYLDTRGGIMTGVLRTEADVIIGAANNSNLSRLDMRDASDQTLFEIVHAFQVTRLIRKGFSGRSDATIKLEENGVFEFNNNKVWHAGNHGAGSGLNADLLDGMQLQAILDLIAGSQQPFSEKLNSGTYTVPANVVSCTFTLAGGGGGGGGGGDGGNGAGSVGGAGGSTLMSAASGTIVMHARGGGGGGVTSGGSGGLGGAKGYADWLQGSANLGHTEFLSEVGYRTTSGNGANPSKGGNGGAGMFGLRGLGTTNSNSNSNGSRGVNGGGGAGSWGQDGAPGGGGGSGGMMVQTIFLTAGDVFTITVGSPGIGGNGYLNISDRKGSDGGFGFAYVVYNR